MKLLIASDLHGSAYYCEKLMERIQAEQPDRIGQQHGGFRHITMFKPRHPGSEEFRDFMFERVYFSPVAKAEEGKVDNVVLFVFDHFLRNRDEIPEYIREASDLPERQVCDYISTMTDNYLVRTFERIYVPKGWAIV